VLPSARLDEARVCHRCCVAASPGCAGARENFAWPGTSGSLALLVGSLPRIGPPGSVCVPMRSTSPSVTLFSGSSWLP
jgi:hypothetical protein